MNFRPSCCVFCSCKHGWEEYGYILSVFPPIRDTFHAGNKLTRIYTRKSANS